MVTKIFASTFDIRQIGLIALNRFESTFEYAAATRVTKTKTKTKTFFAKVPYF